MHRHKVVARIFILLTIASFTFAGHVQALKMHKMRVDLVTEAKNVMQGSEMRHTQLEELLELLGRASTAGHLQSRVEPLQEEMILGAISGVFSGVANGIQKEILGTVSPGASTVSRAVEHSDELPQDQKDPVSRSLSEITDEDLQMLSIISRRMLNNLD